jgi:hypothetical protein
MTPTQASVESFIRTLLQVVAGVVVTYVGANALDITTITSKAWWLGLAGAVVAGVVAAIMRKFIPTRTDNPGVARTDLPPVSG